MNAPLARAGSLAGMVAGILLLIAFLANLSTVMSVHDACPCGRERHWYEMPDSLWPRLRIFPSVVRQGDPSHHHVYQDAQWGVAFSLWGEK